MSIPFLLELVKLYLKISLTEIKLPFLNTAKIILTVVSSFALLDTDPQEVKNIIVGLKTGSAPGWDNIRANYLMENVAPIISHFINLCFSVCVFPDTLKKSLVTLQRYVANNYRSISLLPIVKV